jgi:hypothetical protein
MQSAKRYHLEELSNDIHSSDWFNYWKYCMSRRSSIETLRMYQLCEHMKPIPGQYHLRCREYKGLRNLQRVKTRI